MKNIFYCSNSQNKMFPDNTRSNFCNYVDINDLSYISNNHLYAAVKSITFDNRCNTFTLNKVVPDIIIIQNNAEKYDEKSCSNLYTPYFSPTQSLSYTPSPTTTFYLHENVDEPFTDVKIIECDVINGKRRVMHNIFIHDVMIQSESHFIEFMNSIFKNVVYDFTNAKHINIDIFEMKQDGFVYIHGHSYDILVSKQIGEMLELERKRLRAYMSLYHLAKGVGCSFNGMNMIGRASQVMYLKSFLERKDKYLYFHLNKRYTKRRNFIKTRLNLNIHNPDVYALRSTLSNFTINSTSYDRFISFINAKDLKNDVVHIHFENPSFYSTSKEQLSKPIFEIVDIDTNKPPPFTHGSPTYIQLVIKSEYKMKKPFNIFLDSSDKKSRDIYPNNTSMDFTIKLPERMEFRRNWQMALKTLFLPGKLFNIYEDSCWMKYVIPDAEELLQQRKNHNRIFTISNFEVIVDMKIESGYYSTLTNLQKAIQKQIQKYFDIELKYGKFMIRTKEDNHIRRMKSLLAISPFLSQLLGFSSNSEEVTCLDFHIRNEITCPYQPDIYLLSPRNLMIICDIVDDTIFGGEHVKLIKLVTNNIHDTSDLISFEFLHSEFIELGVKNFDSIRIRIVDTTGGELETSSTTPTRLQLVFTQS